MIFVPLLILAVISWVVVKVLKPYSCVNRIHNSGQIASGCRSEAMRSQDGFSPFFLSDSDSSAMSSSSATSCSTFDSSFSSSDDSFSGSGFSDSFSPGVNIDGSPMCGDTDIHGNPFGVTTSSFDD